MNQIILQQDIKAAVISAIKKSYPEATYYANRVVSPKYPCFFIGYTEIATETISIGNYLFYFYISVQYRECDDTEYIPELNTKLDNVAFEINEQLLKFELYGKTVITKDNTSKIVDNMMQYFCTLKISGTLERLEEQKMEYLKDTLYLKGEK